ncbi:MAG: cadherin-like domain-containing protein, partial [Chloroflexaceae bacterium]|nr:cadherin-like domain-containing protein [Chloroflexaceae bacterium]
MRWYTDNNGSCGSTEFADEFGLDNVELVVNSNPVFSENFNNYARQGIGNVYYPVHYHGVGGAVANDFGGTLLFYDSVVRNNVARLQGGGVYNIGNNDLNDNAIFILNNTTVRDNENTGDWLKFYNNLNPQWTGQGGGIYNEGKTELYNSSMFNNTARTEGGAFYNNGRLTLQNSVVDSNAALSTLPDGNNQGNGGGISNYFIGVLNIYDTLIINNEANNRGGGIDNLSGIVTIERTTIANNSAYLGDGGGIYMQPRERIGSGSVTTCCFWLTRATLTNVTISGNLAGNQGGGIYMFNEFAGGESVNGSTTPPVAHYIQMTNSTVVDNFARWNGGGIHSDVNLNSANYANHYMRNSIVANNQVGSGGIGAQCAGRQLINSQGYNIISDNSCLTISTDITNFSPAMTALAENKGPVVGAETYQRVLLTHRLIGDEVSNSAINRIATASSSNGCPTIDARGFSRPRTSENLCDVGAYEVSPPLAIADTFETPANTPIMFNVTANDIAPEGTLDLTSVIGPQNQSPVSGTSGTIVNDGSGNFTYTPRTGFSGLMTFRYQVRDDSGALSQQGQVSVYVAQAAPPQVVECTPPEDLLFDPWQAVDLRGAAIRPGRSYQDDDGTFATICGAGDGIPAANGAAYFSSDDFRYLYRTLGPSDLAVPGQFVITARLANWNTTSGNAMAGLMVRNGDGAALDDTNQYVGIFSRYNGNNNHRMRHHVRFTDEGGTTGLENEITNPNLRQVPIWLRIERNGTTLRTFYSKDGTTWTQYQADRVISGLGDTVTVGIAIHAAGTGAAAGASFDRVWIEGLSTPPTQSNANVSPVACTSPTNLVTGWATTNIGNATGGTVVQGNNGSTVTVCGNGSGLPGTQLLETFDDMRLLSRPVADADLVTPGVFTATARVVYWDGQNSNALAALMIRNSATDSSRYVGILSRYNNLNDHRLRLYSRGTDRYVTTTSGDSNPPQTR